MTQYFSAIPLFILFRETIEAAIIVSVLLTFLNRCAPQLKKQVWWGVGAGVTVSLLLATAFAITFYVFQQNVFQGRNQMIFNGVIFWVAAIFITFLAFAMLRYKGWEAKMERKLAARGIQEAVRRQQASEAAELGGLEKDAGAASSSDGADAPPAASLAPIPWWKRAPLWAKETLTCSSSGDAQAPPPASMPSGPWWRRAHLWIKETLADNVMFLLVFFTILREGLESVVFLFGVGNTQPAAIPISGLIGIACGVLVGVVLYYTGRTIKDIKWLLFFFSAVLFFIAAGAVENGANLLMRAGAWGPYYLPSYPVTLTGTGAISASLYGVEGAPPAPSAAELMAAGFNDGDEGPVIVVNTVGDGYTYVSTPDQPWWQAPLYDISSCCGDQDSENHFLSLMSAIFGYNSQPTFIDVFFYLGYWIVVLLIGLYKYHAGTLLDADWKHNRAVREMERAGAGFAPLPEPIKPEAGVKTVALDHAESSDHQTEMEMSAAVAGGMGSGAGAARSASEDSSAEPAGRGTA